MTSGLVLIYLVGPYTPLGQFFNGDLTDSVIGVVLAQLFVASPFLIVARRPRPRLVAGDEFRPPAVISARP